METVARTYIGLSTEDGYLVLQGGSRIDILELLNRAQLAQAIGVAFTHKFGGKVFAQWIDSRIEISGPSLPAKFGSTKSWTMIDQLSPEQAVQSIKEIALEPGARSKIIDAVHNGCGLSTLFEDSDGELSTLEYLKDIGCFAVSKEVDSRYYIDVFRPCIDDKAKHVATREVSSNDIVLQLVELLNVNNVIEQHLTEPHL